jgi:glycosyltransferase involved in cell wall biosynthesis
VKISVIIPVGNREQYRDCRCSITKSIELAADCGLDWELVEVFDDDRNGVAWARNEGMRRATGDYLAWVDCDDAVCERWASAIAQGLQGGSVDVLTFDARVEWGNGRTGYDIVYGRKEGDVPAQVFAKDVIGVGRTGGWLWNKVFRRGVLEGRRFVGNAFQDYRMMCEILPDVKSVRYLPEQLYVYRRNAAGISQYVNREASLSALKALVELADARMDAYADDMRRGVAVQAADFCRHAGGEPVLRSFLRRQLWNVWTGGDINLRVKVKCLIEAMKR